MKYKGKQGNSYLFECEGEELIANDWVESISYNQVIVYPDLKVSLIANFIEYKDIQTAVSMMQILIDEGEV